MGALMIVWLVAGCACAAAWLLSLFTREHSWIDRLWSVLPVVYLWVFAGFAGADNPRLILVAAIATLWGGRLTFNFARKGGYAPGGEDYRWQVLRERMPRAGFALFNLFFICIYQSLLLVLITLPALPMSEHPGALTPLDFVVAVLAVLCIIGEGVADQQQWNFHRRKHAEQAAGHEPAQRFATTGLFRLSRHPNYFFELAVWWLVFVFGAIAAGSVLQWTVLGAVLLTVLFIGSTVFTESISRSKYPEYADYQAVTSPVVPWFPLRGRGNASRMWSESR
jgi:steroid 5-alpha reductase family enzyme